MQEHSLFSVCLYVFLSPSPSSHHRSLNPQNASRHSTFQPFVDEPSLPSRSIVGMRSELPLPMDDLPAMDDLPMDIPPAPGMELMDDLDELMRREREEEDEEDEHREVPRNDLSCLFDSPALMPNMEDSEDTTDVGGKRMEGIY